MADLCAVCRSPSKLGAKYIEVPKPTGGKTKVHQDCFKCTTCSKSLFGLQYSQDPNKIQYYCEEHHQSMYSCECGHCGEQIKGEYVQALGKYWCEAHFMCAECGKVLGQDGSEQFRSRDKVPYCETHYKILTSRPCYACKKPLPEQFIEAQGHEFHAKCFTCVVDDHKLSPSKDYHVVGEVVYCEDHFCAQFGYTCGICQQNISGRYLELAQEKNKKGEPLLAHHDCWKCKTCAKKLTPDNYVRHSGGSFFCLKCYDLTPEGRKKKEDRDKMAAAERARLEEERLRRLREQPYVVKEYFTIDLLRDRKKCPKEVHPAKKELHLSEGDFVKAFGISRAEFNKKAKWRQEKMKKDVGIW